MTNDPTSAAYEALQVIKAHMEAMYYSAWPVVDLDTDEKTPPIPLDYALSMHLPAVQQALAEAETRGRITGYHEACNDHLEHGQNWAITKASSLQANADGANGRDGENSDDIIS